MEESYKGKGYIGMRRLNASSVSLSFLIRYVNFEDKIFISGEDCNICEKKEVRRLKSK